MKWSSRLALAAVSLVTLALLGGCCHQCRMKPMHQQQGASPCCMKSAAPLT